MWIAAPRPAEDGSQPSEQDHRDAYEPALHLEALPGLPLRLHCRDFEIIELVALDDPPPFAPDPREGPLDDLAVRRELEARQSGARFLVGAHPAPASTRPLDDL